MLLPRDVVVLPVLEAAVAVETFRFVTVTGVKETGLRELLGFLAHAPRPVFEGAQTRRLGCIARVHGAGHAHGRGAGRGAHAALIAAGGARAIERHVAGGRVPPQEGALRGPALVVLRGVVALHPAHDFDFTKSAADLVAAAEIVEAVACELLGRKEVHRPLVERLEPLLFAPHVGGFGVEAESVVVIGFIRGTSRRGGGGG